MDATAVKRYLNDLHDRITAAVEAIDAAKFRRDPWVRPEGGGGESRILSEGTVFERAGVSFSHVFGEKMPASASNSASGNRRRAVRGHGSVAGVSSAKSACAHHPLQCPVPGGDARAPAPPTGGSAAASISRRTIRMTKMSCTGIARPATPASRSARRSMPNTRSGATAISSCRIGMRRAASAACSSTTSTKAASNGRFALLRSVGDHFLPAYMPIIERRKDLPFGERERQFQLYRRGRYVEFNLVYDRGTLFGLQSRGRTESILMSMPPLARWDYDWHPKPGSPEARLYEDFLRPRDYLAELGRPASTP